MYFSEGWSQRTFALLSLSRRCGHCQHFAPKYKKLAREVTASHPDVRFYAVSCVAHPKLCKEQNVSSYPTVKIFRAGSYDATTGGMRKLKLGPTLNVKTYLKELGLAEGAGAGDGGQPGTAAGAGDGARGMADVGGAARVVPFRALDVDDARADAALSFEYAVSCRERGRTRRDGAGGVAR